VTEFKAELTKDFAGATMHIDNVKSLAEHVAKYPTYEEAMAAMENRQK